MPPNWAKGMETSSLTAGISPEDVCARVGVTDINAANERELRMRDITRS